MRLMGELDERTALFDSWNHFGDAYRKVLRQGTLNHSHWIYCSCLWSLDTLKELGQLALEVEEGYPEQPS